MIKNINRKCLSNKIHKNIGFSKIISENILNDIFSIIKSNFNNVLKIKIKKFGTFSKKRKKERLGRNPKTKEEKLIFERNVITFKPSFFFRKKINR